MILIILKWLKLSLGIHLPAVFGYTSTRILLGAVTGLLITLFSGVSYIKLLTKLKCGQPILEELKPLHKGKKDTPTMGGGLILFALIVSTLLWADLSSPFPWLLIFTSLSLGALGGYDDYLKLKKKNSKGLSPRKKLLFQLAVALVVISYFQVPAVSKFVEVNFGITTPMIKEFSMPSVKEIAAAKSISLQEYVSRLYVPFFKEPIVFFSGIGLILLMMFFVFVIVGSSNAVNLTDGLDGLATGLLICVSFTLGVVAFLSNHIEVSDYLNILYVESAGEVAVVLFATGGALLGFLWFNCHPAEVFMGDTGSLSLGGLIGVSSILLKREFLLGLVGAIFVAEALSVILQVLSYRYRNKKRIFLCAPLHHHFEYLGWAESKVVIRFWIVGILLSFIGLASIKFQ